MGERILWGTIVIAVSTFSLPACTQSVEGSNSAESLPSASEESTTVAPLDERWTAYCEAAFDAGRGNASGGVKASWVSDCIVECASPTWERSCREDARTLGLSIPK